MKKILLLSILSCMHVWLYAQIQLNLFSQGYTSPLGIENCADSRLFIVQQTGQVIICDAAGQRLATPYLDISDRISVGGERGLLGLAFDPGYQSNGFFYVNYTNKSGNTQVSRFTVKAGSPNQADKASEKFVLNVTQPFANHNGGCLRFGPDGYLYIGLGDGGSVGDPNNNAQNPLSLLGKMLRIDVHSGDPYAIPPDNPFRDSVNYRPEIWALGLRNPWRWSFDALNGSLIIADVGQDKWEEVNFQQRGVGGLNYGWRCAEGRHAYNTAGCGPKSKYTMPVYEYLHSNTTNDCSITGGFVYRGSLYPGLYGKYFFVDYCSGIFRTLYLQGSSLVEADVLNAADNAFVSFGEDRNRELYVANIVNGSIYRVAATTVAAAVPGKQDALLVSPNPSNGKFNISFKTNNGGQLNMSVTDKMGVQYFHSVKNVHSGANAFTIEFKAPAGNYFLRIVNASGEIFTSQLWLE